MNMSLTKHAAVRIAQRIAKREDLQLLLKYAVQGDHELIVTTASIDQAEQDAIEARRNADRLRRMKGVHMPLGDDGCVITLERLNRGKLKRVLGKRDDWF